MNKVLLVGRDPEIRFSPSGTVFSRVSLATERSRKADGVWVSETDWHTVIQIAKALSAVTVKKGDLVAVEGALRSRKWEADGEKHWITEVISSRVRVLTKNRKFKLTEQSGPDPETETLTTEELDTSEIPF